MSLEFEWDAAKARENARRHRVEFDEAVTAFQDPLSLTIPDPDHSFGEARFLSLGMSSKGRLIVVSHTERGDAIRIISAREASSREWRDYERGWTDMRDEYDFSKGVRGKYAKRYAQGTNLILLDPDLAEKFPDSESVNNALRQFLQEHETTDQSTGAG